MNKGDGFNVVLCGRGGQGILFAAGVLETAALANGLDVLGSETHGMAQRGGSVVSHLKVGAANGPLVAEGDCDTLVSLEKTETYKNLRFLKPGGVSLANLPEGDSFDSGVTAALKEAGVSFYAIDADAVARSLGSPQGVNAAMLGLLAALPDGPFGAGDLEAALRRTGAERFREKNVELFKKGLELARKKYGF